MSDLSEFFLNTTSQVAQLDLVELSHPSFTKTYRICPQARDSVTVDLSPSELAVEFERASMRVTPTGARDDLDSSVTIDLGDLGETLPPELDAVTAAGGFTIKPAVRYWVFGSDDLTQPLVGPILLEVISFNFNTTGATFEAKAPSLNSTRTGERYKLARFKPLRGYL